MSSTNRSKAREKHIADYYCTPVSQVVHFIQEFNKTIMLHWDTIRIVDPCAGGDIVNPMSYPTAIKTVFPTAGNNIFTIDIREDSRAKVKTDYLKYDILNAGGIKPDMIITNPPFVLAEPIIEKSIADVKDGGYVIMLLRLNFFGSLHREAFFKKHMPSYAWIHRKRMSFTPDRKTDSIEYMHTVFIKGQNPSFCKIAII